VSFRAWARHERVPTTDGRGGHAGLRVGTVLLWVDTFSNYFHPEIARAALTVLRDAGFDVAAGQAALLRPAALRLRLLDEATVYLRRVLDALRQPDRRRPPGGRARTELRVGVPRRAAISFPDDRARIGCGSRPCS
jgi:hypothetical protein